MAIRYQSAGEAHREGPDSCPSLGQDLGWGRASPERKGALRAPQSGPRSPGSRVPELLAARSRIPSTGRCRKPPDTHSTMQTSDIRAQARRTARAPTPARLSGRIWDGGAPRRSERAQGRKGARAQSEPRTLRWPGPKEQALGAPASPVRKPVPHIRDRIVGEGAGHQHVDGPVVHQRHRNQVLRHQLAKQRHRVHVELDAAGQRPGLVDGAGPAAGPGLPGCVKPGWTQLCSYILSTRPNRACWCLRGSHQYVSLTEPSEVTA